MKPAPSVSQNDSITAASPDVVSACLEIDFFTFRSLVLAAIEIAFNRDNSASRPYISRCQTAARPLLDRCLTWLDRIGPLTEQGVQRTIQRPGVGAKRGD